MSAIYYPLTPQIQAFEVNALPLIYLNRVSVFYYVFVLAAVLVFGIIIREALFNLKSKRTFLQRVCGHWKWLFFVMALCFFLIDLKMLSFQRSRLIFHLKNFSGKSLDEARSVITGYEIYEFARFCQEKIPQAQSVKLFTSDVQTRYKQLAYYLYPLDARRVVPLEEVDYIIIFHARPDLNDEQLRQFRIFARRKDGQIILERIKRK
ncbi:MAG: hypothetical protein JW869_00955 [Candidatus Omnitrophica bacterium]|nr:hypothetical protein [Candidatus Omnitrophota bacterium]